MQCLPNEIWLHILSYEDLGTDFKTLISLSLSCKALFHIAQPMLYRIVSAAQFKDEGFRDSLKSPPYGNLRQRSIQNVAMDSMYWVHDISHGNDEWEESDAAFEQTQFASEDQLLSGLDILQLLPNIKTIEFAMSGKHTLWHASVPSIDSLATLPFLHCLRHLILTSHDGTSTNMRSAGELVVAAPLLSELTIQLVDQESLLAPILNHLDYHALSSLPLKRLNYREPSKRHNRTVLAIEEVFHLWTQVNSIDTLEVSLSWLDVRGRASDLSPTFNGWPGITDLAYELWTSYEGIGEEDSTMVDLAYAFPNLRKLSISQHWIGCTIPSARIFDNLSHLTLHYRDRTNEFPFFQVDPAQIYRSLLNAQVWPILSSKSFAPNLRRATVYLEETGAVNTGNLERIQWMVQLRDEVISCGKDVISTALERLDLSDGEYYIDMARTEERGFRVRSSNLDGGSGEARADQSVERLSG